MSMPDNRWKRSRSAIFGFDIFLSYRRDDASAYAEVLTRALASRGFTCFIDRHETETGVDLDPAICRALKRSRMLVVIVTPGALKSQWVGREVSTFASKKRPRIVPISVDGILESADLTRSAAASLGRFGWLRETREALAAAEPAPALMDAIAAAFASMRVQTRSRIAVAVTLTIVMILGGSVWRANREKNRQTALAASGELAARAQQEPDPSSALDLAVQAMHTYRSSEAVEALRTTLAANRLRGVLKGHSGPVTGIEFSPDGKWLASASEDTTAIIWNVASGREQWRLRGHSKPLSQVTFSSDSKMLITVSLDGTARSWEVQTGHYRQTVRCGTGAVRKVALHPAKSLAAVAASGVACLWDISNGAVSTAYSSPLEVTNVVFSRTGRLLAAVSGNSAGRVWEMTPEMPREVLAFRLQDLRRYISLSDDLSLEEKARMRRTDPVRVTFSVDERYVLAAKLLEVEVFDIESRRRLNRVPTTAGFVSRAVAHPWSTLLLTQKDMTSGEPGFPVLVVEVGVSRGDDNIPRVGPPRVLAKLSGHSQLVSTASFSPDGSLVATMGNQNPLRIWDSTSGVLLATLPGDTEPPAPLPPAFSPDTRWVASGGRDTVIRLWDLGSAVPTGWWGERVFDTAVEPSGRHIAALATTGIRLYEGSNRLVRTLPPGTAFIPHLETLGQLAWFKHWLAEKTVALSEFATGEVRAAITAYPDNLVRIPPADAVIHSAAIDYVITPEYTPGLAVSPDGTTLAVRQHPERVAIWKIAGAQHRSDLDVGGFAQWLTFTHDGKHLLVVLKDSAEVWDVNGGEQISRWAQRGSNFSVPPAVSTDGTRVLITKDPSVRDLPSGRSVATLAGFDASFNTAAFSRDSSLVCTGQLDGKVDIWNTSTGVRIARWQAHSGRVTAIAFSADGTYVATGGEDRTAKIWMARTEKLMRPPIPHSEEVRSVVFRDDGQLVSASARDVLISVCDSCGTPEELLVRAEQLLYRLK